MVFSREGGTPLHVEKIELCEILKTKLGEKEAKTLVEYIEAKADKKLDEKKTCLRQKLILQI